MTPIETALAEIKRRLEAATPGPWAEDSQFRTFSTVTKTLVPYTEHDAHLIVHAPTDLARLIAALELAIEQRDNAIAVFANWKEGTSSHTLNAELERILNPPRQFEDLTDVEKKQRVNPRGER